MAESLVLTLLLLKYINKTSDSAIGQHLLDNPDCAKLYNDDKFWIIGRARSSFQLKNCVKLLKRIKVGCSSMILTFGRLIGSSLILES